MKKLNRKCIPFISTLIFLLLFSFVVKANVNPIVDDAKLLSQTEKLELNKRVEKIREKYNMDAVIVTSNDLGGKSPRDYADDYYDYNGYGLDNNKSGLLLLIDMYDRNIWISTTGDVIKYFTDSRINSIINDVSNYLSDKRYFDACNVFLDEVEHYIELGIPKDQYNYSENDSRLKVVLIALAVSLIASTVVCIVVVNSYKNTKSVSSRNYVDNNSIVFTKEEIFL